jgi:hypothetical protein
MSVSIPKLLPVLFSLACHGSAATRPPSPGPSRSSASAPTTPQSRNRPHNGVPYTTKHVLDQNKNQDRHDSLSAESLDARASRSAATSHNSVVCMPSSDMESHVKRASSSSSSSSTEGDELRVPYQGMNKNIEFAVMSQEVRKKVEALIQLGKTDLQVLYF